MTEPCSIPPASTFIVRFWREWSATGWRWRGQIQHVQSGQRASCLALEGILDFIKTQGVMADQPTERGETGP